METEVVLLRKLCTTTNNSNKTILMFRQKVSYNTWYVAKLEYCEDENVTVCSKTNVKYLYLTTKLLSSYFNFCVQNVCDRSH